MTPEWAAFDLVLGFGPACWLFSRCRWELDSELQFDGKNDGIRLERLNIVSRPLRVIIVLARLKLFTKLSVGLIPFTYPLPVVLC